MEVDTKKYNSCFVSVIVPVYNDATRIVKCIEALINQTYPHDRYEVIVIDNGSTDETRTVVKKYPVKLLIEEKIKSSYAARNRGLRNTQGEVIAFTDSDCIPDPDWIERGVTSLFRVPKCGLVAGEINIFFRRHNRPNAIELHDSIMGFNQKRDIERHRFGSTANVFTFKKVIDDVGLFNDNLKSGGDNEWGRRVFAYGYKQVYAHDTVVAHPARNSIKQLYERTTRLMRGNYDQHLKNHYSSIIFFSDLIKSIKKILAYPVGIFFDMFPDKKVRGYKQKIQFICVSICVEIFRDWERLSLLIGFKSRR